MLMVNDTQSTEAKEIARKKNLIAVSGLMVTIPTGIIGYQVGTLFGGFDFGIAIGVGAILVAAGGMLFVQTQLETMVSDIEVRIKQE